MRLMGYLRLMPALARRCSMPVRSMMPATHRLDLPAVAINPRSSIAVPLTMLLSKQRLGSYATQPLISQQILDEFGPTRTYRAADYSKARQHGLIAFGPSFWPKRMD